MLILKDFYDLPGTSLRLSPDSSPSVLAARREAPWSGLPGRAGLGSGGLDLTHQRGPRNGLGKRSSTSKSIWDHAIVVPVPMDLSSEIGPKPCFLRGKEDSGNAAIFRDDC
jgi:hypothetical protein